MLDRLKSFFLDPDGDPADKTGAFASDDERVAVAALLVHMIRIDGEVTEEEQALVRRALHDEFGISGDALDEVIAEAERRDDEAVDLYGFTSTLKSKLSDVQRLSVIELLWRAVYADGHVNEFEDNMVWRTAELLGVSTRDRVTLRRKVAGSA